MDLLKKRNSARSDKQRIYFEEYIKLYLQPKETISNIEQLYEEILEAYNFKLEDISKLRKEIRIIKRLHV